MRITDGKILCGVCGVSPSVVYCDGCEIPICDNCRKLDLWGYGCGHVDPKSFCKVCHADIKINPYSGNIE